MVNLSHGIADAVLLMYGAGPKKTLQSDVFLVADVFEVFCGTTGV